MMTMSERPEKSFDCVEFKRQAQQRIYEKIKDLTPAEEIEFFRREAESGPFAELIARIKATRRGPVTPESLGDNIDTDTTEP